jgi:RND family efflux transporter MFP subunit
MNRKSIVTAGVLCMLALAIVSCSKKEAAVDPKKDAKVEAIAVSTAKVTKASIAVPILATGSLTPVRQTDIGPFVDGIIEKVWVGVGSRVKEGEPLFKTRDIDIRLQVRELESQVALARAQLANAKNELNRQSSLKSGGWVSASRMDTTKTGADVAAAQLGIAQARLSQAKQALSDTTVHAPYTGVISRKDVYEGRFMATRFGGIGGGSSGVVQIMAIDPLAVIVVAPSTYFGQMKVGMRALVHIDGVEKPVEAKVAVVNYGVDYKSRGVEVRLSLPNPGYKILPGLYAKVDLFPESHPALVVERRSVLGPEGARYAFIAENGRAKKIKLSIRELDGERVEITSNVPEGTDFLVGPNLSQLADGVPVKIEQASTPAKPSTQAQL